MMAKVQAFSDDTATSRGCCCQTLDSQEASQDALHRDCAAPHSPPPSSPSLLAELLLTWTLVNAGVLLQTPPQPGCKGHELGGRVWGRRGWEVERESTDSGAKPRNNQVSLERGYRAGTEAKQATHPLGPFLCNTPLPLQ